ncbi:MAG: (d)CMP kinase, partial [Gemmatimonadetes bacterium]|nr:(d)CMP kinase [Gemmatimonadota bacterium]
RACADISYPGFWEALAPFRSTGSGRPDPVGGPDEMPEGGDAATDPVRGRVVAIDGPAASGKSTTARSVADELGFVHVNSGLFYRAVTWWALREGLLPDDPRIARDVSELDIGLVDVEGGLTVSVDRRPLGDELRGADVTAHVSAVSTVPEVRAVVLERLRESGRRHSLVCDGRDIGTTVFPEAELKIFLVADVPERARRRLIERSEPATPETVEIEARRLEARDRTDASRASSPLRKAADAVEIDTTRIPPTEVVARIVALARDRGLESPESTGGSGPAPGARPC